MPTDRLTIKHRDGKLIYEPDVYEIMPSRMPQVAKMINNTVQKFNITQDFDIVVRIADGPWPWEEFIPGYYAFCTHKNKYYESFPDFNYIGQHEAGVWDYTELVNSFVDTIPETNKIGWAGGYNCGDSTPRPKLGQMSKNSDYLDIIEIQLPLHYEDAYKLHSNYLTYQQQIDKWKYLIDVEGCGWSGRLKILLSSPRIVFFVDRPWQEWFFEFFKPWEHYVPVKRDLSDLHENYLIIENDINLQNHIKQNVKEFAKKYLTLDAAENRIHEILKEVIQNNFRL